MVPAKVLRQISLLVLLAMPVSTIAQPPPSSSNQRLM
jgi:hypothetical protein